MEQYLGCFLCCESLPAPVTLPHTDSADTQLLKQQHSQALIRLLSFLHEYVMDDEDNGQQQPAQTRAQGKAITDSILLQTLQSRLKSANYCKKCSVNLRQIVQTFKLYDSLGQKLEGYKNDMVHRLTICNAVDRDSSRLRSLIIDRFNEKPVRLPKKEPTAPANASDSARLVRSRARALAQNRQHIPSVSSSPVVELRRLEEIPELAGYCVKSSDTSARSNSADLHRINIRIKEELVEIEDVDVNIDVDADPGFVYVGPEPDYDSEYELPRPKKRKTKSVDKKSTSRRTKNTSSRTRLVGEGKSKSSLSGSRKKAKARADEGVEDQDQINKPKPKPSRTHKPIFPCDFEGCDFQGRNEKITQKHLRTAHPSEPRSYSCPDANCGARFIREERLARHRHWVHSGSSYPCQDCDYTCNHRDTMEVHRLRVHGVGEHCPYADCGYMGTAQGVRVHLQSSVHADRDPQSHGQRKHMCQHCGRTYISSQQLKYHVTARHPETVSDPAELNRYRCDHCGKILGDPPSLRAHITRVHLRQYNFHCEVCGAGIVSMSHMRRHMNSHLTPDQFEFECEVCHAKFRQKTKLTEHMRRHTGDWKHCCDQCDKKFINSGGLKRHMRIHAGVLEHVCHICNKAFPLRGYLVTHMNSHETPEERQARKERQRQAKPEVPVLVRLYNDMRKKGTTVAQVAADPQIEMPVPAYTMHYDYRRERKEISRVLTPDQLPSSTSAGDTSMNINQDGDPLSLAKDE